MKEIWVFESDDGTKMVSDMSDKEKIEVLFYLVEQLRKQIEGLWSINRIDRMGR